MIGSSENFPILHCIHPEHYMIGVLIEKNYKKEKSIYFFSFCYRLSAIFVNMLFK